jgi:PKD repeat protein
LTAGQKVTFRPEASSACEGQTIVRAIWAVNGQALTSSIDSNGVVQPVTYMFSCPGSVSVILTLEDNFGSFTSLTRDVVVLADDKQFVGMVSIYF